VVSAGSVLSHGKETGVNGRSRRGFRTMDFRQAKPVEEPVPSRERASPTAHVFNLSFSVSELGYCAPAKTL